MGGISDHNWEYRSLHGMLFWSVDRLSKVDDLALGRSTGVNHSVEPESSCHRQVIPQEHISPPLSAASIASKKTVLKWDSFHFGFLFGLIRGLKGYGDKNEMGERRG